MIRLCSSSDLFNRCNLASVPLSAFPMKSFTNLRKDLIIIMYLPFQLIIDFTFIVYFRESKKKTMLNVCYVTSVYMKYSILFEIFIAS